MSNDAGGQGVHPEHALTLLKERLPKLAAYAVKMGCSTAEAEDVAIDSIIKLLHRCPDMEPIDNERSWLYKVVGNEAKKIVSKRGRCVSEDDLLLGIPQWNAAEPHVAYELLETLQALGELPLEQREAVLLAADGLSYEEIATISDVSVSAAKQRVSRGRATLRALTGRSKPSERDTAGEGRNR
ncbi:RNA polymerase sigma factor [Lentzea sp. NPDC058436]|uniref:RNA polymerase sigma factor n=1 Tax=Lentzea sp. NPDC058436 TaxID=3346499 RepID=UPI00364EEA8C